MDRGAGCAAREVRATDGKDGGRGVGVNWYSDGERLRVVIGGILNSSWKLVGDKKNT